MKDNNFILTSIQPTISCYGMFFESEEKCKQYAEALNKSFELCKKYIIHKYENGKCITVFESK